MLRFLVEMLHSGFKNRQELLVENALLRYQLAILRRGNQRVWFKRWDRLILAWLCKRLPHWKEIIKVVQPETIVRWHRKGFALYWGWRYSSKGSGRRRLDDSIIELIREISRVNPLWGAPRIHGEILKLGFQVSEASVAKYMIRRSGPPTGTWRTFLANHMKETIAIDFMVVPTIRCRLLWALVVLSHDRRKIIHTAVTHSPSSPWTMQQLRNAFAFHPFPKYLIHDRDRVFRGLSRLGMEDIQTGFRSPWQNGFVERVIGSIRRECTDHLVVLGERHLQRVLKSYTDYYNHSRTHLSLNKDSPVPRAVTKTGRVRKIPYVGGLHHEFTRTAA